MGEFHNLAGQEAIDKLRKLAEGQTCMFLTELDQLPIASRPMATQRVDADGNFWFFSGDDTQKNMDIRVDDRVQLIYMNSSSYAYLSLYGKAEVVKDDDLKKELWNVFLTTWYPDGPTDPNLVLLKFVPSDGYYWDTQHNKMVAMVKVAIGAMKGKMMDDSREGKISLEQ